MNIKNFQKSNSMPPKNVKNKNIVSNPPTQVQKNFPIQLKF